MHNIPYTWTALERTIVRDFTDKMSDKEIAAYFSEKRGKKVSAGAIRRLRRRMGLIKKSGRPMKRKDAEVRPLFPKKKSRKTNTFDIRELESLGRAHYRCIVCNQGIVEKGPCPSCQYEYRLLDREEDAWFYLNRAELELLVRVGRESLKIKEEDAIIVRAVLDRIEEEVLGRKTIKKIKISKKGKS